MNRYPFLLGFFQLHRGCDRVFGRIGFRILPAIQLIRDTVAVFAPFRIQCFVSGCSFFDCLDPCPIAAVTVPALKGIALTAWIFQGNGGSHSISGWIGLCIFTTVQLIGDAVGSGAPLRIQCQISGSFLDAGYLVLIFTVAVPALEGIPLTAWVLQGNGRSHRIGGWIGLRIFPAIQLIGDAVGVLAPLRIQASCFPWFLFYRTLLSSYICCRSTLALKAVSAAGRIVQLDCLIVIHADIGFMIASAIEHIADTIAAENSACCFYLAAILCLCSDRSCSKALRINLSAAADRKDILVAGCPGKTFVRCIRWRYGRRQLQIAALGHIRGCLIHFQCADRVGDRHKNHITAVVIR